MQKSNVIASFFSIAGIVLLFLKLPHISELVGLSNCVSCQGSSPYLLMLGAAYFALFTTALLSFPSFPKRSTSLGGLIWATGLTFILTYFSPVLCVICLIAHACHISAWLLLFLLPRKEFPKESFLGLKFSVVFTAPIAMMALFSTLHFTLMIYGIHVEESKLVKVGDVPTSSQLKSILEKESDGILLHFISEDCPYCKNQLPILSELQEKYPSFSMLNVITESNPEILSLAPNMEWLEDLEKELTFDLGVSGYPTIILLDKEGAVLEVLVGVRPDSEQKLLSIFNDQLQKKSLMRSAHNPL